MDLIDFVIRIAVIIVLSMLIGLNRGIRHKPAGAKTHILVGMGSTLFMVVSLYIYYQYKGTAQVDPGRIAAQVVTGIGFLGAGSIIQSRGSVTGLTTAASLWATAAIGLAVGVGMIAEAVIVTVAILIVFVVVNKITGAIEAEVENVGRKIKAKKNKKKNKK